MSLDRHDCELQQAYNYKLVIVVLCKIKIYLL